MKKKLIILSIITCLLTLFLYWQNNGIVISNFNYYNNKINFNLDGFKIVQISDLHNKQFGSNNKNLIKKIKAQNPDIIVITGDIVDGNRTNIPATLNFIEKATEIAPVYYVTGNHEYQISDSDRNTLMTELSNRGVIILNNTVKQITFKTQKIYLIGLDEKNLTDNTLNYLVSDLPNDALQILLVHEPQEITLYADSNVDFVFSGHAHGGQIRLPFVGGILSPNQGFFPKYSEGLYKINETTMVVSRGLGNSVFPFRIFNRPEIVVVTLKSNR